mmetsp:Transcript_93846/g.265415  ORF Transcript_93846/g.265415 Transcript_93846/m.265415 type:complete len:302 (+) Transcript_93846:484-1389(+)
MRSCPRLESTSTPSAVTPTRPSPTISRRSAAGAKAHPAGTGPSSAGAGSPPGSRCEGSALKSCRCLSQPTSSVAAQAATSFQSAAESSRTSRSAQGAAPSEPRGSTAWTRSRHVFAQSDGFGGSSSSHLLPFAPSFSVAAAHARPFRRSRRSTHSCSSGNCIWTACQLPRMQSLCLPASASMARCSAHRNCARSLLGAQSYAARTCAPANSSSSAGCSNQSASSACARHLWNRPDAAKHAAPLERAWLETSPSPITPRTAYRIRVASAKSASWGLSSISGVAVPPMAAQSACRPSRAACRP